MHQLCAARGIPYHHFLQPNQYVPGSKPLTLEERTRFTRDDHPYRQAVLDGYPELRKAGEELRRSGVAFHDLTDLFADEERTVYGDDCCHLNAYGNRRLAEAVAAALRQDLATVAAR
jgi:lysophospholipase L1-like esterase